MIYSAPMSAPPGAQGNPTTAVPPTLVVPRAGESFAGYELIDEKLNGLGAHIERVKA